MIKIAIVEDEKNMREMTYQCIESSADPSVEIEIVQYAKAEGFLDYLEKGCGCDILLTDIELPKISGVELGRIVREKYPEMYLIFLTSHSEFAAESYRLNAYQYIMKKDMDYRLPVVMRGLIHRMVRESKEYRWIGTNLDRRKIYYKDIICIRKAKASKYVEYVMADDVCRERITISQLLKELDSDIFILVDRSYIVNMNHIIRVRGNTVYLEENERITISRAQIMKVKDQISQYWRNQE